MKRKRNKATVTIIGRDCLEGVGFVNAYGQWMTEDVKNQWREHPEHQFLMMIVGDGTTHWAYPSILQLEPLLAELSQEYRVTVEAIGEQANAAYTSLPNHGRVISEHADGAVH